MPHVLVNVDDGCRQRCQRVEYKFVRDYNLPCYHGGGGCMSGRHARHLQAAGLVAAEFAPADPLPEPLRIALAPIPLVSPVICCPPPAPCPPPPLPANARVVRRELVPLSQCAPRCCPAPPPPPAPLFVVANPTSKFVGRVRCPGCCRSVV